MKSVLICFLLFVSRDCFAGSSPAIDAAKKLEGTIVLLKTPALGEKIEFSSAGKLTRGTQAHIGNGGLLQVKEIEVQESELVIKAKRVVLLHQKPAFFV